MESSRKKKLPVHLVRKFLEPGPIVLVSSAYKGKRNIMTMGWHTVMEFSPSLFGCIISSASHSFEMIKKSRECVINIPTADMAKTVAEIGNCSGREVDKFSTFGLTPARSKEVQAPRIKECYANFECRLYDARMISKYNFFIWEVVHALTAIAPAYPETIHYTGDGVFMKSGGHLRLTRYFRPENL